MGGEREMTHIAMPPVYVCQGDLCEGEGEGEGGKRLPYSRALVMAPVYVCERETCVRFTLCCVFIQQSACSSGLRQLIK